MQPILAKELAIAALQMALRFRQPTVGLVHHSDRGSQYASNDYQRMVDDNNICYSMSRKGNGPQIRPWSEVRYDNAAMESFFASLKREWVDHKIYANRQDAKQDIFYYIEVWYNRKEDTLL
jgi:transposase InsO family protein